MAEFIAGTDPTDLTDRIHPEIAPSDNPGFIKVRFNARAAFGPGYTDTERRYTLWQSTDLKTDSWEVVPGYESTAGRNLPVEAEIIQSTGHSFFRLSYDLVSPPIN